MAKFIEKCPHCQAKLRLDDEWIGRTVRCPLCGNQFVLQGKKNGNEDILFTYTAMDNTGRERHGRINAGSKEEAVNLLKSRGMFPTLVEAAPAGKRSSSFSSPRRNVWKRAEQKYREMMLKRILFIFLILAAAGTMVFAVARVSKASAKGSGAPARVSTPLARAAKAETFRLPGNVELVMMKIPAGSFMMGSPKGELGHRNWEKQHRVTLSRDYWLGKYEVTQGQWKAVMGDNPVYSANNNFPFYRCLDGDNYPVEMVSWYDARNFCDKLNELYAGKLPKGYCFDLPTEAQWEYACRAGTTTALNNGKDLTSKEKCSNLDEVGWYSENHGISPNAVGGKRPNAWGLYDMHGNVAEWCRDWYDAPLGGPSRVYRGGGRHHNAQYCRSASRHYADPNSRFSAETIGFRLALVPVHGKSEKKVNFLGIFGKKEKKIELSLKAKLALEYVKNLPEGQKNVLLHGTGSAEDKANAMANLSASGHLEGFAEYLEATSSE